MNATIHWARIAWTIAAVVGFGAGEAQITIPGSAPMVPSTLVPKAPVHTVVMPVPQVPAPSRAVQAAIVPVPDPRLGLGRPLGQPVVLRNEQGGNIAQHQYRFFVYQRDGDHVELRGPCYSACTLITAYVPKDRLCIAPGAFMAFHGAQTMEAVPQPAPYATQAMYRAYPQEIRDWINRHGGVAKLPGPRAGYWTMYDRDLWAIGYPRCR